MDLKDWSEDTYTIKDVVDKLGLPNLVLVSEGFLNEDDGDLSFGSGDIIQLNFVKQISHFIAIPLENDTDMGYGNEISIPVGYRGSVKIVEDIGKVFDSVQGLVDGRPRFVRTESSVACIDINNSEVVLPAGVTLELKQNVTGKTVMCKYGGNSFTIDVHQSGHFSLLPDNTEYLLEDMISRLPVTIKFVNSVSEFNGCDLETTIEQIKTFSGIYRLVRVTCEDFIVGFYRDSSDLESKCFTQTLGTVALLPLENPTVQQLEVHVSSTKQTSIFADTPKMCNHNENIFSNDGTVTLMESKGEEDVADFEDFKPSVPPRTYRRLLSFSSKNDNIEKNNPKLITTDRFDASNEQETMMMASSQDSWPNYKTPEDNKCDIYSSIKKNKDQAEDNKCYTYSSIKKNKDQTEDKSYIYSSIKKNKDQTGDNKSDIYSSIKKNKGQTEKHDVDDGYCMLKDILPPTDQESSPTPDDTDNVAYSEVASDRHIPDKELVSRVHVFDTTADGYSIVKFESDEPNQELVSTIYDTTADGYSTVKFESRDTNQESVSTIYDTTADGYSTVMFESRDTNQENLHCDTQEDLEEPVLTKSSSDPSLNTDCPQNRKRDASKRKTFKRSMKAKMEKLSSKLSKIHIKREDSVEDDRLHRQNSDLQSPTIKDDFHSMSVSEVAQCFRLSELPTMATVCEKEDLDGQFFVGLTIGYLTKAFDLSNIDALKVQKLSKGWRPQDDIEDDETRFTSF